jgi:hypothetical protein
MSGFAAAAAIAGTWPRTHHNLQLIKATSSCRPFGKSSAAAASGGGEKRVVKKNWMEIWCR